ncbi:MAG: AAA family ATPase [Bdellovibrionaceae bacterium]|nr:AAA family ATPase [Pseudobdellovibrionaceae bacterium]
MIKTKVIVSIGTGGVGKTTVSAALGYRLATEGLKVLVLTIDPSQRLATTLGIGQSKDIVRVKPFEGEGLFKGELYASVVDHQSVFNEFIMRAAKKDSQIQKIINNKLYKQLSTSLSGSQEFTALEKLYSCYETGIYDYIILDTPPSKHAIDFLNAPEKLASLFNENITKWFKDTSQGGTWLSSLISSGTKQVLRALEMLTGSEFIKELSLFFTYINDWQDKLHERTIAVHSLLTGMQTEFYLVTGVDDAKLKEASQILRLIRKQGYHLTKVIMNKALPSWNIEEPLDLDLIVIEESRDELIKWHQKFVELYLQRMTTLKLFFEQFKKEIQVVTLIEYNEPISDIVGLHQFAKSLNPEIQN